MGWVFVCVLVSGSFLGFGLDLGLVLFLGFGLLLFEMKMRWFVTGGSRISSWRRSRSWADFWPRSWSWVGSRPVMRSESWIRSRHKSWSWSRFGLWILDLLR